MSDIEINQNATIVSIESKTEGDYDFVDVVVRIYTTGHKNFGITKQLHLGQAKISQDIYSPNDHEEI